MLNPVQERAQPARSASLRSTQQNASGQSSSSSPSSSSIMSTSLPSGIPGTGTPSTVADPAGKSPELAFELQRLHELKRQVAAQEQRLSALRAQDASRCHDNHNHESESETMKALVFAKEKELALALMKVAELTRQLEQLRCHGSTGADNRNSTVPSQSRTVTKPTTAPPPPPVGHTSTITLTEGTVGIPVIVTGSRTSNEIHQTTITQTTAHLPGDEKKKYHNNNNEDTPYAKLVHTMAALARSHRRSEHIEPPKRSESVRQPLTTETNYSDVEGSAKKNGTTANRLSDPAPTGTKGQSVDRMKGETVGCFGLDLCMQRMPTEVKVVAAGVNGKNDANNDGCAMQKLEVSADAVNGNSDTSCCKNNCLILNNGEALSVLDHTGKMSNASSSTSTDSQPLPCCSEDIALSSAGRVSSSAQMMSCFAPRPYGMSAGGVTMSHSTHAACDGHTSVSSSSETKMVGSGVGMPLMTAAVATSGASSSVAPTKTLRTTSLTASRSPANVATTTVASSVKTSQSSGNPLVASVARTVTSCQSPARKSTGAIASLAPAANIARSSTASSNGHASPGIAVAISMPSSTPSSTVRTTSTSVPSVIPSSAALAATSSQLPGKTSSTTLSTSNALRTGSAGVATLVTAASTVTSVTASRASVGTGAASTTSGKISTLAKSATTPSVSCATVVNVSAVSKSSAVLPGANAAKAATGPVAVSASTIASVVSPSSSRSAVSQTMPAASATVVTVSAVTGLVTHTSSGAPVARTAATSAPRMSPVVKSVAASAVAATSVVAKPTSSVTTACSSSIPVTSSTKDAAVAPTTGTASAVARTVGGSLSKSPTVYNSTRLATNLIDAAVTAVTVPNQQSRSLPDSSVTSMTSTAVTSARLSSTTADPTTVLSSAAKSPPELPSSAVTPTSGSTSMASVASTKFSKAPVVSHSVLPAAHTTCSSSVISVAPSTASVASTSAVSGATVADSVAASLSKTSDVSSSVNSSAVGDTTEAAAGSTDSKTIDTSSDSVISALSVLMKGSSPSSSTDASGTAGETPGSPKSAYKYASRGSVSGIYRRKLGSSSLDQYSRNMDQLYGVGAGESLSTKSPAPDSAQSPTAVSPSVVSPPYVGLSSPSVSFRDSVTNDGPDSLLRRAVARPSVPPPPPPALVTSGGSMSASGVAQEDAVDGEVSEKCRPRPKCMAPHIARRVFLYGDIDSPTSDEFKPFDAVVDPSAASPVVAADSKRPVSAPPAFEPPSDFSTLYIDDEDWRGITEQVITSARPMSADFRPKRRSLKPPKTVRFDPCALLLSAAAEGDLDTVRLAAQKALGTNTTSDIAFNAIKNSVTNHHCDVAKYLVEYGCDVNLTDGDGWSVLHFAAAANDTVMAQLLVNCGACILVRAIGDHEMPEQKCSQNVPGYEECCEYLRATAAKLGVGNNGVTYAGCSYNASSPDELSFAKGDSLKIIRRGDGKESEWWWASFNGREGYVPQNLLSMYPPPMQKTQSQRLTS